jgi:hypothetical protein
MHRIGLLLARGLRLLRILRHIIAQNHRSDRMPRCLSVPVSTPGEVILNTPTHFLLLAFVLTACRDIYFSEHKNLLS